MAFSLAGLSAESRIERHGGQWGSALLLHWPPSDWGPSRTFCSLSIDAAMSGCKRLKPVGKGRGTSCQTRWPIAGTALVGTCRCNPHGTYFVLWNLCHWIKSADRQIVHVACAREVKISKDDPLRNA